MYVCMYVLLIGSNAAAEMVGKYRKRERKRPRLMKFRFHEIARASLAKLFSLREKGNLYCVAVRKQGSRK